MKKIIITTIIAIAVIVLAIILIRQAFNSDTKPGALITPPSDYEEIINNNYLVALPAEEIALEFIEETEAQELGLVLRQDQRIQVLARDDDGQITQYRLIHSDKDIVKRRMVQ